MEYRTLGRSGLKVSPLCLGTMNFGPFTEQADAFTIMDAAQEAGINFFDTANDYGGHAGKGKSEEIIGDWFDQGGGRREKTVLATKVYAPMSDWPNDGGLSAYNIRQSLDASLRRLKTDHIDILLFHHIDRSTPWDEIWEATEVALKQGKIIYSGSSNFGGWHIAQAQEAAKAKNMQGLICDQSFYNLFTRDIEREVIPAVTNYGMGLCPWSPLNQGLLGGVIRSQNKSGRRLEGRAARALEERRDQIQSYEDFADELGHAPGALALAWLLHQPAVTAPIVGPRILDQLTSGLEALNIKLDTDALNRLDEIFPGYKQSPEDYAW